MKVLITGITGFAGSHLADYLLAQHPEAEIFGIRRWRSPMENIAHNSSDRLVLVETDLKDYNSVYRMLERVKPDYIFHLAAQSFVPTSWNAPASTLEINVIGPCTVLGRDPSDILYDLPQREAILASIESALRVGWCDGWV